MRSQIFLFKNQHLELHPLGAIYWQEQDMLLLADWHLGKAQHFRKAGLAVPTAVSDANFDKITGLLLDYEPERVLILGDLFHSVYNNAWEAFADLLATFKNISFELVPGNHDILGADFYKKTDLHIHELELPIGPFLFTHEPMSQVPEGVYNLAGHIHPCSILTDRLRRRVRLACFYFGKNQGLLPAFGEFTGMAPVRAFTGDRVFVIAEDRVLEV